MKTLNLARFLFYAVGITVLVLLIFGFGLYSGGRRTAIYRVANRGATQVVDSFSILFSEASTLTGQRPEHFLQPARRAGRGVTVNEVVDREEQLVLIAGFFEDTNELRLVQRNGNIVRRWPVRFSDVFPNTSHIQYQRPPATDWNVDIHGSLALPDGSVVFNFEWSGLVKLDRCGQVTWTLPRQTHHSVVEAAGGGFWVPSLRFYPRGRPVPFPPPFVAPLEEDTLLRVSEHGQVVEELSYPGILYENGLESVLTAYIPDLQRRGASGEMTHINKIAELSDDLAAAFPDFRAGDLLLSDRSRNMLMVLDPATRRVRWWRIGPWLRQHDPEFTSRGTIVLFNNNTYRFAGEEDDEHLPTGNVPRGSNIVEFDPATQATHVVYSGTAAAPLLSVIRGKVDSIADGGLLITEFEGGRVVQVDSAGRVVWEYINRYGDDEVSELTDAHLYPRGYFTVPDWSCPADQ